MRVKMLGWLIATTLSSGACQTLKPVTLDALGGLRPSRVWVTRADQAVVVVEGPQLLNNRLVGFVDGKYQVMPAADVTQVLMRAPARGRTAVLVTAGAVGVAAIAYLVSGGSGPSDPCAGQSSDCEP